MVIDSIDSVSHTSSTTSYQWRAAGESVSRAKDMGAKVEGRKEERSPTSEVPAIFIAFQRPYRIWNVTTLIPGHTSKHARGPFFERRGTRAARGNHVGMLPRRLTGTVRIKRGREM